MLGTIMPTSSIKFQLSKIRKARELLEKKEKELLSKTHETTIAKIVQIASDNGITAAEIVAAIKFKKTKKTSFLRASPKKVPEKNVVSTTDDSSDSDNSNNKYHHGYESNDITISMKIV